MEFEFTCGTCSCCHDVYDVTTICNICLSCIIKCDEHTCHKITYESMLVRDGFRISIPVVEDLD